MLKLRFVYGYAVVAAVLVACSPSPDRSAISAQAARAPDDSAADAGVAAVADQVEIVKGVADRGRDPAVIAINIADEALCSGTLISPRLVMTARHCVDKTVEEVSCPASGVQITGHRTASTLSILVGEDVQSARVMAHGQQILTAGGVTLCDEDIAFIVLDEAITTVKPVGVRKVGPAVGDHVRAVGFGLKTDTDQTSAGKKLVREHVRVQSVSTAEFTVGEATCSGDSGGPALDEDTSEVIGVVSRGGPTCEGAGTHNIYTRVDAFAWLVEEAFTTVGEADANDRKDAGASDTSEKPPKRGTDTKPASDVGGPCEKADDCATGICITQQASGGDPGTPRAYCSRPCGTGDRCPTSYHCEAVSGLTGNGTACVSVP